MMTRRRNLWKRSRNQKLIKANSQENRKLIMNKVKKNLVKALRSQRKS